MDIDLCKQMFLDGFKPVPPGHPKVKEMMDYTARYIPLDEIERKRGTCKWCWEDKCPTYRHKYCSDDCRLSAEIFCYPQRELSKAYHLHLQKGLCANCEREFGKFYDGLELRAELDHCLAIFRGGQALGHENHQLLCRECHKFKSIQERKR